MSEPQRPVIVINHYASDAVQSTGSMLGGLMHGDWEFFRTDGSVMRTGTFDRGRQVGRWRTFDRVGRLVKETDFGDPTRS
ncbi:MAG: toxin-antitoxin system YwqK family antitoxin [Candidatus Limnocylindrales bacterium]